MGFGRWKNSKISFSSTVETQESLRNVSVQILPSVQAVMN